ncbi:MAG: alpha/beta fold hydrolase [Desulfobacterales bacterium]
MSDIQPVERHVDIGDAVIGFLDYESDGPPLLLLHATGFQPRLWHPVARHLIDTFHVVAPYFCDHRGADPENGGFSWRQIAEDMAAFCEKLNFQVPYVVGHSMGGAVPVIAAGALGMPVAQMVLIEPIFLPEALYQVKINVSDHPLAAKSIKRRNAWRDPQEARQYLKSKPLFQRWDPEVLELYIRYGMVAADTGELCLACHPRREAALFMGSMSYNPWPVIPNITCPVLVIEGEHTENKGFIDYPEVAKRFPHGRHQVVPDAGHLVPMEKPEQTVSIIREFFTT